MMDFTKWWKMGSPVLSVIWRSYLRRVRRKARILAREAQKARERALEKLHRPESPLKEFEKRLSFAGSMLHGSGSMMPGILPRPSSPSSPGSPPGSPPGSGSSAKEEELESLTPQSKDDDAT